MEEQVQARQALGHGPEVGFMSPLLTASFRNPAVLARSRSCPGRHHELVPTAGEREEWAAVLASRDDGGLMTAERHAVQQDVRRALNGKDDVGSRVGRDADDQ